jgi:hypothetical protein
MRLGKGKLSSGHLHENTAMAQQLWYIGCSPVAVLAVSMPTILHFFQYQYIHSVKP